MNTNLIANAGLQSLATGLIGLAIVSFTNPVPNIFLGVVEVVAGLVVYAAYELIPTK